MKPITIGLVGAPHTGKTELAMALEEAIPSAYRMPEYARTYITRYGPPEHPAEQMLMLRTSLSAELSLADLHDVCIVDSPAFIYAVYGMFISSGVYEPKYQKFHSAFRDAARQHANHTSITLYLPASEIEYSTDRMDDVRWLTPAQREEIDTMLREHLVTHTDAYTTVRGTTEERVQIVLDAIEKEKTDAA